MTRSASVRLISASAFFLGFTFSALVAILFGALFPFLFAGVLAFAGGNVFLLGLGAGVLGGLLSAMAVYVLYILWVRTPVSVQLLLVGLILTIGVLTIQPEVDFLALLGLMLTALGVKSTSSRR